MLQLTIIIPVYNGEKTIKRAIDSLINQLDETIELMIINDGSNDNTHEIVQEFINNNSYISYYQKENEGIAKTRNFGITHAKGKYIMFVDSDDYIEENLIQKLQDYMNKEIDIVKFKLAYVDEAKKEMQQVDGPVFETTTGEEAFNQLVFSDVLMDSPCVYIFKKELFKNNHLFFKEGTYHEDFGLIPLVLLMAQTLVSTNVCGYYYVQTKDSITRNQDYQKTKKRLEDTFIHYDNMIQFISKNPLNKQTKTNIKIYYTNAILLKLKSIDKEDRKHYIKQIKRRKMISNIKPKNLKQLLKRILLSININWYLSL
ncbi:MAG: glycosyltransferase family 2 protein [Clostridia bacterium]|nr:glycosyltransferase family 2 protein [Clostridia bacterium]